MTRMRRKLRVFLLLSHISSPKSIRRELFSRSPFAVISTWFRFVRGFVWAQLSLRVASFSKYRPRLMPCVFISQTIIDFKLCVQNVPSCSSSYRECWSISRVFGEVFQVVLTTNNSPLLSLFIFPGLDSESEASVVCRSRVLLWKLSNQMNQYLTMTRKEEKKVSESSVSASLYDRLCCCCCVFAWPLSMKLSSRMENINNLFLFSFLPWLWKRFFVPRQIKAKNIFLSNCKTCVIRFVISISSCSVERRQWIFVITCDRRNLLENSCL